MRQTLSLMIRGMIAMRISIKILVFSILLFLCLVSSGFAETFYVRPLAGEYGSEDGSDYDNAFDGFGDISWGGGAGNVGAADTLYVCGVHYETNDDNLTVGASGTSGNVITIRGDCSGDNGLIITGANHWGSSGWTAADCSGAYYRSGGVGDTFGEVDTSSLAINPLSDAGVPATTGNCGSWSNGKFHVSGGILYFQPTDGTLDTEIVKRMLSNSAITLDEDYITVMKIRLSGGKYQTVGTVNITGSNIILDELYMRFGSRAIKAVEGADYVTVEDSEIGIFADGIYPQYSDIDSSRNNDYWTIRRNYIHDIDNTYFTGPDYHAIGIQGGTGHEIYENYFDTAATAVTLYCGGSPGVGQCGTIDIYRNYAKNIQQVTGYHGYAYDYHGAIGSDPTTVTIYNNVADTVYGCYRAENFKSGTISIYNNTCKGITGWGTRLANTDNSGGTLNIRNNIFEFNGGTVYQCLRGEAGHTITFNLTNNLYYPNPASNDHFAWVGGDCSPDNTLTEWQSNTSSETNTVVADPKINPNGTLQSGSPAINAGVNLGDNYRYGLHPDSIWPLSVTTLDFNLYGWPIAAYGYLSQPGAPSPPGNLRITLP